MIPIPEGKIGKAIIDKYFPSEEWEHFYSLETWEVKRIADYTRLSFNEVLNLPYGAYLLYRKESWIASFQTEHGREFLKTLWRLQQTKADVAAVREYNRRR